MALHIMARNVLWASVNSGKSGVPATPAPQGSMSHQPQGEDWTVIFLIICAIAIPSIVTGN